MMGEDDVIARICQNIVETKIRHRKSVLKGKRYIMSEIFTLGIDVGSTASKCIILKDGKEIVGKSLIDVGPAVQAVPSRQFWKMQASRKKIWHSHWLPVMDVHL